MKKNRSNEENEEEPEQSNHPVSRLLKGRNGRTKNVREQKSLFPEEEVNEK